MMKNKELLEQAEVYGNWYGIPKDAVKKALENGEDTIVKIDIQGAATIKSILPQAVFIFLVPPSIGDLRRRLKQRHTELPSDFALRLGTAEEEMKRLSFFDYIVINRGGEIDRAVADITAIITAEKCRLIPREVVV
jgi:guanylate kinase|tara:strand:+ start:1161 stop:1568 length:408 start_codon:yes stop_codon:yes gene_type:complete